MVPVIIGTQYVEEVDFREESRYKFFITKVAQLFSYRCNDCIGIKNVVFVLSTLTPMCDRILFTC